MLAARQPKYQQIKRRLRREIDEGTYAPGAILPSEAALLERFGASRPTVVRSLQELVREGVVYRRQGKGTFVSEDFRPDPAAGRPIGGAAGAGEVGAAGAVPVFISDDTAGLTGASREVLLRLLRGIEQHLTSVGRPLLLRNVPVSGPTDPLPPGVLRLLDASPPGPALVVEASFSPALLAALLGRGWSACAVNEPCDATDEVCIDQEAAGFLATAHLLDAGRRRVALLNGPPGAYWGFDARLRGYRRALESRGVAGDAALELHHAHPVDSEAGRAMVRRLIEAGVAFDAAVGATDSKALGAWAALEESGRRVPGDVLIVSIDDTIAARAGRPLASVTMPFEAVGRRAAQLAVERHEKAAAGLPWFRERVMLVPAMARAREAAGAAEKRGRAGAAGGVAT